MPDDIVLTIKYKIVSTPELAPWSTNDKFLEISLYSILLSLKNDSISFLYKSRVPPS